MDPAKPSRSCCELSFVIIVLNFRVLSPPCRYAGYGPEVFKQTGRELSFNKLCLTLVYFHLHAGMQVTTLRSLQANRS